MKPKSLRQVRSVGLAALCTWLALCASVSCAADIVKANNTTALNLTGSWVGGVVPTAADVGLWDSTVTAANTTVLGGTMSWQGIRIANPAGLVTINNTAGATLTLGTAGIDMSAATQNLTYAAALTLGSAQAFNIDTGRTLTLSNLAAFNVAAALTKSGGGTMALTSGVTTGAGTLAIDAGAVTINASSRWNSGAITVNSGGTLQNTGAGADSIGNAVSVLVNAGGAFDNQQTGTETITQLTLNGTGIGGTGAWTNASAGTAGTMTLTSGLVLASDSSIGGTGNLATGSVVSGVGFGLTKVGTGTLTLTGANTYSGKTTVSAGTLSFNSIGNVGAASSALGAPTTVADGTIDLAGVLTYTGGAASSDRVINVTSGAVQVNNSGSGLLTLTGGVTGAGTQILFRGTQNITETGVISFAGAVAHTDSGTLTLTNPGNSFTGTLSVATGTINANSVANSGVNSAIGAGSQINLGQNNTSPNGTFQFSGTTAVGSSNRAISLTRGSGTTATTWTIENTTAGELLDLSGDLTLSNPAGGTGTMTLALTGVGDGELSGDITGSPAIALIKTGTGTWTLSGTNTSTGATTVRGGTLNLDGTLTTGVGFTSDTASSTVNVNGTVTYGGGFTMASAAITSTVNVESGGVLTLSGSSALIGQNVTGAVGILHVKNGGTLNITTTDFRLGNNAGTNSADGYLTMDAGSIVNVSAGTRFDIGNGTNGLGEVNLNGGTLTTSRNLVNGSASADAATSVFNFNGGTLKAGAAFSMTADLTRANVRDGGAIVDTNGFTVTLAEPLLHSNIGGDAAIDGGLTKNGTGTLILTGANTYTGAITINAGTLQLGNAGTTGALLTSSAITNDGNLTINRTNAVSQGTDFSGSPIVGSGSFTQAGTGTTTLTAVNTYSGDTTVNAGTLVVGVAGVGSIANSAVTVNAGGTLIGSGTTGALNINGGTFSPGNSPGTMSTGAATYGPAGTYTFELDQVVAGGGLQNALKGVDPGHDWHDITGALTITATSGGYTVAITGQNHAGHAAGAVANWDPHDSYTWTIATASGGISGFDASDFTLNSAAFTSNNGIGNGSFGITTSGNDLQLTFSGATVAAGYWDLDGATAGAGGGTTPTGTWDTVTGNWSYSPTGLAATQTWVNGDDAVFSAGGTATGAYTVTIAPGGVTAHNITVEEGTPTITGDTLTLAGTTPTVTLNASRSATISSVIDGTAGLTYAHPGASGSLTLSGASANTYTGTTIVNNVGSATFSPLILSKSAGVNAIPGDLQIGNGSTGYANVNLGASDQIADTAVLTFSGTAGNWAYFKLLGNSETVAGIVSTANGVIENMESEVIGTNSVLTLAGSGTYSFTGFIRNKASGAGTGLLLLTKLGTGTQTLSGPNITYTGATALNDGILILNNTSGFNSPVTVAAGKTLQLTGATSVDFGTSAALVLNNGSTLDKASTGYTTYNSVNVTVSGTTAINVTNNGSSNQLFIGGSGGGGTGLTGTGVINVTNTGTATTGITFRTGVNPTHFDGDMNVSGGATFVTSGAGLTFDNTDLTLTSSILDIDGAPFAAATGTATSVKSLAGNAASSVVLGGFALTLGTNNGTGADFAGAIGGTGALVKTGTGTQTLSGTNTYTGTTTINAGTLTAASSAALGAGAGLTFGGGTLHLATDTALSSKNVTMSGNGAIILDRATTGAGFNTAFGNYTSTSGTRTLTVTKGANVTSGTASLTFSGTLSMNQAAANTNTFDVGAGASVILSGSTPAGAQTISLVKDGAGTLVLNGSYGTWDAGNNIALNAGTLDLRSIPGDSGVFRNITAAGSTSLELRRDGNFDFRSTLNPTGSMSVVIDRATAAGTATTHTLGQLTPTTTQTLTFSKGPNITGAGTLAGLTFSGRWVPTAGTTTTFDVGTDTVVTLAGSHNGAPSQTHGLVKQGVGTLVISGSNTFWEGGAVTLSGGTLDLRNTNALGDDGPANAAINAAGGTTLRLANDAATNFRSPLATTGSPVSVVTDRLTAGAGVTHTLDTLTIGGNHTLNVSTSAAVTSGTQGLTVGATTLNGDAVIDVTDPGAAANILLTIPSVTGVNRNLTVQGSGDTTISGAIATGTGTLTKDGSGTLTLLGTSSYTGVTDVDAGTLTLNGGNIATSSLTTVASGATLNGTGTTGPLTIDAGGTHSPGLSPGTTTVMGDYIENGTLVVEFASAGGVPGTHHDLVDVTSGGTVTINAGTATLSTTYLGVPGTFVPTFAQVFTIIQNDLVDGVTGNFSGLPAGATVTIDSKPLKIYYDQGTGNDVVLVSNYVTTTPIDLYVDGSFTTPSTLDGDLELAATQTAFVGTNAFASPALALAAYLTDDANIIVNGGTYASALLAGGADVTLRLVNDTAAVEPDITIQSLSGDSTDAIVTRYHGVSDANLIVESGSFAGVISGGGNLTKTTSGTLTLSGPAANTYGGSSTVNDGTLELNKTAGTNAIPGNLVIGDGVGASGSAATQLLAANQIANTSDVTVNSDGLLDLNSFAESIDGLNSASNAAQVTLGSATLTVGANNDPAADYAGTIAGTGGLTKTGTGTQTLSGTAANTYSGTTNVNDGSLLLNKTAGVDAIAGNLVVGDGAGLAGTAVTQLLAANQIANTSDVTVNSDGLLDLNSNNETIDALNAASSAAQVTLGAATLTVGADNEAAADYAGTIAGTGGLTKTGSGTQTLSGTAANTYSGTTNVNDGSLLLNKTAGVNAIAGNLVVGDGAGATGSAVTQLLATNQIADTSDVTINSDGLLDLNSNNETIDALNSASSTAQVTLGSATLTVGANNDGAADYAGTIAGTGGLTKTGTGTQTLSGTAANTYSGTTNVNDGSLLLDKTAGVDAIAGNLVIGNGVGGAGTALTQLLAADQIADTSDVTINSDGLLDLNSNNETIDALNAASSSAQVTLGTATLTVGGNNDPAAAYAGSIAGAGDLTKIGTGTQVLSGGNSYAGTTLVSNGVLVAASNTALGATSGDTSVSSGATLRLENGVTVAVGEDLTIDGPGFAGLAPETGALLVNGGDTATWNGTVTVGGTGAATIGVYDAGTLNLNGAINNTSGATPMLTFLGDDTGSIANVSAAITDTAAADTIVDSLTVNLTTVPQSLAGQLSVQSGGTVNLVGVNVDVGTLELTSGNIGGNSILQLTAGNVTSSGTSTIGGTAGTLDMNGQSIDVTGGTLSVTRHIVDTATDTLDKIGSGTLDVLNGATVDTISNTGGGTLDLSGGTVTSTGAPVMFTSDSIVTITGATVDLQDGTINSTGSFTLISGTLQDVDLFTGNLVQDGGTLRASKASAADPEFMDIVGDYTQNGGILEVKIEGNYAAGPGGAPPYPDYDIYDVAGNVYLNGILKIVLQDGFEPGFTAVTGVFFDVLLADMLTIGPQFALDTSMATFTSSPYRGWVYEVVQLPDGRFALRLLVTPEPASYLVWAVAGLAALLYARRRRRQASP